MSRGATYTNFRSATSEPNTPETDLELFVWHTVNYTETTRDGRRAHKEMELLASDPMEAINQAYKQLTNKA